MAKKGEWFTDTYLVKQPPVLKRLRCPHHDAPNSFIVPAANNRLIVIQRPVDDTTSRSGTAIPDDIFLHLEITLGNKTSPTFLTISTETVLHTHALW